MSMIYDLDGEYGGTILSDNDTAAPALKVNSNSAGQPALSIQSTASGSPMIVDNPQFGNATVLAPGARFRATATGARALEIVSTVAQDPAVAPLRVAHLSAASAVVAQFGSFVSVTSVILTSAAHFDYVIRVALGDGTFRSIPLIKDAGIVGSAAF